MFIPVTPRFEQLQIDSPYKIYWFLHFLLAFYAGICGKKRLKAKWVHITLTRCVALTVHIHTTNITWLLHAFSGFELRGQKPTKGWGINMTGVKCTENETSQVVRDIFYIEILTFLLLIGYVWNEKKKCFYQTS